ncbi:beta-D-glucosyl crocetin beta-1,6-glucosyltransferase-like [Olea europaea var. sylvestris]|uniref:beta-D-glucosyl crocetin beta-1,6-glucosyltransferase-like n=1 Tax=Olea europaea var. sylvestris TaxID=158386 RepID=UPI000C1D451E|nr:beta-D-glucosyl crocetin beta-1,6-glucosyltransferase-like [Olea europaea var. sylvestris]
METNQRSFRILMFPWLAHGHIFPFLELSKKLLSKKNFKIYFCSTPVNIDSMKNSLQKDLSDFSIEFVELHLPSLPELPPQYHTTKNVPPNLMPTLMQAFQLSSSSFSSIISNLKPDLLIYDGFQPWAPKLASSQGIPAVLFSISGATQLSFFHHMHTYGNATNFPYPAIYSWDYELKDLKAQGESIKVKDADEGFAFGIFKQSRDIVLVKTCKGIEEKYIDYLSILCHRKIVPVGPLVTDTKNEEENSEIKKWLSTKDQFSTVYISFGSENYLSKEQMEEIAVGLELINVNFIWVVRFPAGNDIRVDEYLPEGFLERAKERGKILQGWAPQAEILSHSSIGGFMSHCGWSSVIETIYFGVPLIAMPLKLDQPINARMVVEAGAAVEVMRDDDGRFRAEEVAKAVKTAVLEKSSGEGLRTKAMELSQKMKMEEEAAINEAADQLWQICMKNPDIVQFS